ncbi:Alpha/Beta hydrolase protein [Phlebopus sp. FC_14]|nr:Alpha/Beta hydrolase protein [Phlebopus sp. FC_14]
MVRRVTIQEKIALSTGVVLETAVGYPKPERNSTKVAFCLHPWSWLGGNMDDPTVQTIVRLLSDHDFYTVSYNSRGVGNSTGWPSFTGELEGKDLQALVQRFLEERQEIKSVTFIGYSHGSLVATLHPALPSHIKTSYVLLSYPLSPRGLLTMFHTSTYLSALRSLLLEASVSMLIIYGDKDDFTSKAKYDAWAERIRKTEDTKAQLEIISVARADHFWHEESTRASLKTTLESWLAKVTAG